jgi:hypothetical protein
VTEIPPERRGNDNINIYEYVKYKYYRIPSSFPFWKIVLFFLRWFVWSYNAGLKN